jgi:hypothetical protein
MHLRLNFQGGKHLSGAQPSCYRTQNSSALQRAARCNSHCGSGGWRVPMGSALKKRQIVSKKKKKLG